MEVARKGDLELPRERIISLRLLRPYLRGFLEPHVHKRILWQAGNAIVVHGGGSDGSAAC